ncbi:MAG: tandem-95 repeat protein, partial [Flavobacteriales bacterium]
MSGSFSLSDLDGYSSGFLTLDESPLGGSLTYTETALGQASWNYTPNENFCGDEAFSLIATDDFDQSQVITIQFTVEDVNDPLTATILDGDGNALLDNETFTEEDAVWTAPVLDLDEGTDLVLSVSISDSGDGFTPATGLIHSPVTLASLSISSDGTTWTISALDNVDGPETITVDVVDDKDNTITWIFPLNIVAVNDGDLSLDPQQADVLEDESNTFSFLFKDPDGIAFDGSNTPLNLTSSTAKGNSTISFGTPYLEGGMFIHPATVDYVSPSDFFGLDTIRFSLTDDQGFASLAELELNVQNTQDPTTFTLTVPDAPHFEDETLSGSLDFSDADGLASPAIDLTQSTLPNHGTLIVNETAEGQATWSYTPANHYFGADAFSIAIVDAFGEVTFATVTLDLIEVDDPLNFTVLQDGATVGQGTDVAANTTVMIPEVQGYEDTELTLQLDLDDDADGLSLPPSITDPVDHGSANLSADGTLTLDPQDNWNGQDSLTVTVEDDNGHLVHIRIPILWSPMDDGPALADPATATVLEEEVTTLNFLFSDPDGLNANSVEYLMLGTNGVGGYIDGGLNGEGQYACSVQYTGAQDFFGADQFQFKITDNQGFETTVNIALTVENVQDDMVYADSQALARNTDEEVAITGTVTASDADGDVTAAFDSPTTALGSLEWTANGNGNFQWRYVPSLDLYGADSFSIVLSDGMGETRTLDYTVDVAPVNDDIHVVLQTITNPDEAAASWQYEAFHSHDDTQATHTSAQLTVAENGAAHLKVTASDPADGIDIQASPALTPPAIAFSTPSYGSLQWTAADGHLQYTPSPEYHGQDEFTITFTDESGFTSVLTLPVLVSGPTNNATTIVSQTNFTATEEVATTLDFELTDPDGLTATAIVHLTSEHGTVSYVSDIPGLEGAYAPGNWSSSSTGDASVAIDETVVLTGGTGEFLSQTDVQLTADGWFAFSTEFTEAESTPGLVTSTIDINGDAVTITSTNGVDMVYGHAGDVLRFTLSGSAGSGTGSSLTVRDFTPPSSSGNFSVSFLPMLDFYGQASIGFCVRDLHNFELDATLTVDVANVQDPTVVYENTYPATPDEDETFSGQFKASDADLLATSNPITASTPSHGTLTPSADNAGEHFDWTYTPNAHYHGAESFTITVTDAFGVEHEETISFDIQSLNDPFVLTLASSAHTNTLDIAGYSMDSDGESLTTTELMVNEDDIIELTLSGQDHDGLNADYLVLTSGPANGSQTTIATSNALEYRTTFTPTPEYTGQDALLYTMTDVDGHTVTVEVPINFAKVDDELTNASHLQGNAYEGLIFTDTLTISDADGLPLTLTDADCLGTASILISDDVDHGTLAVEQSAIDDTHIQLILHYRSNAGSSQNDQFTLSYTDNQCFTHSETYSIQVTALPDMTTFGGTAQHVIKEEETVSKVLTYSDGDGLIQSIELLGTCPTDYAAPTGFSIIGQSDTSIYCLSDNAVSYYQARIDAASANGYLATYHSSAELDLFKASAGEAWIGASRQPDQAWTWTTGQTASTLTADLVAADAAHSEVLDASTKFDQFAHLDATGAPAYNSTSAQNTTRRFVLEISKQHCYPHGRFTYTESGQTIQWTYTPDINFVGTDRATFAFTDYQNHVAYRTLSFTMTDVEDRPIYGVNQTRDDYQYETTTTEVYGLDLDAPGTASIQAELGDDDSNILTAALTSATDYEGYYPTEGAVARFSFDNGSLTSSIGSGITLTPLSGQPSMTSDRFATVDKALRITDAPMSVPAALLPSSLSDFSVALWFSLDGPDATRHTLLSNATAGQPNVQMWVENNHLFAQIGNETMSLPFNENIPASVGDWHLAVLSFASDAYAGTTADQ